MLKKQILFFSFIVVLFSLFLTACAEDSDSEAQSADKPQPGTQGLENISGEGKLCGDGTCDEAEEESGFCTIDCE